MQTTTIPTALTKEQYSASKFAYVRKGANKGEMWLVSESLPNAVLWIGKDLGGLKHTKNMYKNGVSVISKEEIFVKDETGNSVLLPMYAFPPCHSLNDLDLEMLAQGVVEWV